MYEVTDGEGKTQQIPIDKIALRFTDPETGKPVTVPVTQLVVGGMDYDTINKYPFVYDRKNGYISIGGETDVFMRRLEKEQIELIENILKIKAANENEAKEIEVAPEKIKANPGVSMKK